MSMDYISSRVTFLLNSLSPPTATGARFGGVTLRSRQTGQEAPPRKAGSGGEGTAEFHGLKLRKAGRGDEERKTRGAENKHDFGVKLKVRGSSIVASP